MSDSNERGSGDGQEVLKEKNVASTASQTTTSSKPDGDDDSQRASSTGAIGNTSRLDPSRLSKLKDDNSWKQNWSPNDEILEQLAAMGINKLVAEKALYFTGNNSAELAISWIFENPEPGLVKDSDDSQAWQAPLGRKSKPSVRTETESRRKDESNEADQDYKMVFVVNCSLDMGLGKACAQVAHAALGMQLILLQDEAANDYSFVKWLENGETKIVLKGENTQQLKDLEKKASELKLPTYLVQDAGRTQIPAGSTTVLSIFGRVDIVDQVTGSLRLL